MFGDDADILTSAPVALDKAPVDPNLRRSDVFCSKIIQPDTTSARRFQCSQRVHKIMEYNGIVTHDTGPGALMVDDASGSAAWPKPRPRPLKSPYPCFNCHRMFAGPPIFMPERLLNDQFEEDLNFCSGACMNTYIHFNLNDASFASRSANALEYMRKVHGFKGSELGLAPHFSQHVRYGGELTDEQFDAIIGTPALTTRILAVPFIPSKTVIEWTCSLDAEEGDKRQRELHAEMLRVQAGLGRRKTDAHVTADEDSAAAADDDEAVMDSRDAAAVPVPAPASPTAVSARKTVPVSHSAMSLEQNLAAASQGNGSIAAQILNCAMGQSATVPPHHRCWQTRNLRQPPLEAIEQRLAALPPLEKHDGAYELYLQAKGGFDEDGNGAGSVANGSTSGNTAEPKVPPSKKARTMASRVRVKTASVSAPAPERDSDTDSTSETEPEAEAAPEPPKSKSKPKPKAKPKPKPKPMPASASPLDVESSTASEDEQSELPERTLLKPKAKAAAASASASASTRVRRKAADADADAAPAHKSKAKPNPKPKSKPKPKPELSVIEDDTDDAGDANDANDADDAPLMSPPKPKRRK